MAFINTPPPAPGTIGHDDNGIPHLNVPGEGYVPLSQQLHGDLLNSPAVQTGGAPSFDAPAEGQVVAAEPIAGQAEVNQLMNQVGPAGVKEFNTVQATNPDIERNNQGLAFSDGAVNRNAPVAPFDAGQSGPMAAASVMPKISTGTESKTSQKAYRPEDIKKEQDANNAVHSAVLGAAKAVEAKSKEQLAQSQLQTTELVAADERIKAAEAVRQADALQRREDLDAEIQKQSDMKVDPNYFGRMDTGSKIATIFGILLSGVGSGLQGGGAANLALNQLNKAADLDIDAQKANIAKQGAVVSQKRGAYSDFLKVSDDARIAELAEKNRIMDIFKSKLEQVDLKNAGPIAYADAQKTIAGIDAANAQRDVERNARIEDKSRKNMTEIAPGGGSAGVNARIPQSLAEKQIAQREALAGLDSLEKLLNDKNVTKHMGAIEGEIRGKALGNNLKLNTSDEATYYNAAAKATKAQTIKGLYGSSVSKHEQEAADSFTPAGLGTSPDLEKIRIAQARDKLLREQKITDDTIKAYRTGKIVDSSTPPKSE